jgi:hypothetical protein
MIIILLLRKILQMHFLFLNFFFFKNDYNSITTQNLTNAFPFLKLFFFLKKKKKLIFDIILFAPQLLNGLRQIKRWDFQPEN